MNEFFSALTSQDLPFLRYALLAGLLSSPAFGIIGTYVVVNRITSIAGAISHAALAGIGAGLYFGFNPLAGATIAALIAGLIISFITLKVNERVDSIIGMIWAVGMSIGLLFIAKSPGYQDPMSYLFGNILLIGKSDLYLLLTLDIITSIAGVILFHHIQAISFDAEFARSRGIHTDLFQIVMIMMISVTVVLMVTVVGIVMVIALLTIPAATAGLFSNRLKTIMLLATVLTALFHFAGLALSYTADSPTGATTIIIAAAVYTLSLSAVSLYRKRKFTEHAPAVSAQAAHPPESDAKTD
ncbi:MAG: metal ABC transporter permease [Spirochaetia bacterium]|nr:metal ABC transporter permease [Spirochaetia bacterium]MCF7940101.1 metal ABC transporter permease [Spirochaetia bacterium]